MQHRICLPICHPLADRIVGLDDSAIRSYLGRTLKKEGWKVFEAENGRAGLEKMEEVDPALILLDLIMPEMDGFEFIMEIRKNASWRSIPIIVLTAKNLTEKDRARLGGNVERIIQKGGFTREELMREICDLVVECAGPAIRQD